MQILTVSDEVHSTLYNIEGPKAFGGIDILLSCGDLPYTYLEYLVTMLRVPHAYYVHGNHDSPEYLYGGQMLEAPGGWVNIDRTSVRAEGLLIAGLEGSIRYKPHAPYQYSEWEMFWRSRKLILQLFFNKLFYGRYLDILIAHSPAAGIHDGPDVPHKGFEIFLRIMRRFRPKLFLHGHKHHYGPGTWHSRYQETQIINVHPFRLIQVKGDEFSYGKGIRR